MSMSIVSTLEATPIEAPSSTSDLVKALRHVSPLEGLEERDYLWLAEHGREIHVDAGKVLFHQDDPAEYMSIILHGEIHVRRRMGAGSELFIGRAGEITGLLPFSRMKTHGGEGVAMGPVWLLAFNKATFPEMLQTIPSMKARLVALLLDRVREVTRMEQQVEKLSALNKLAGNLAHELNNPASAAQRSAMHLQQELRNYGHRKFELGSLCLPKEKIEGIRAWEQALPSRAAAQTDVGVARADREQAIQQWLEGHAVPDAWNAAPVLTERGLTAPHLESLAEFLDANALPAFLSQFASTLRTEEMTVAILHSTARIFDLIEAIKDYSYLDQAPLQDIDMPQAIRNTLAMLQSRLANVQVVEKFEPNLPRITAFGAELNQVWMALLENALDAMEDRGRLEVVLATDPEWLKVEIHDNGIGIPPEMKDRIFEPFFTTKPPGKGLGMGLDTVMRIIRKHRGHISVTSKPGDTCFQVMLPREQWRAY
jgi:signal transduction histidine kinase